MKKSPIENIIISDEDLNNILPKDFLSSLNETKISNLKKQLQILIEIAKNIVTKKSSNILKSVTKPDFCNFKKGFEKKNFKHYKLSFY